MPHILHGAEFKWAHLPHRGPYVCVDGSGYDNDIRWILGAGWAVVSVSLTLEVEAIANGPSPLLVQDAPSSERYAFFMALCLMGPVNTVCTDCQMGVDGWEAGELSTTHSNKAYAELWRQI